MINTIRLKNFKCYRDSGEIPFAPLTVIIGCNNAGKSSILHAILALKQTLLDASTSSRLITRGDIVDLGSFHDILYRGRDRENDLVSIELTRVPLGITGPPAAKFRESTSLGLEFSYDAENKRILAHKLRLADDSGTIMERNEAGVWDVPGMTAKHKKHIDLSLSRFLPNASLASKRKKRSKNFQFSKMMVESVDAIMSVEMQSHGWMHLFRDLDHIKPLRAHVPFHSILSEQTPSESGMGEDSLMRMLGSNQSVPPKGPPLRDVVNEWMSTRFKTISKLSLEAVDKAGHIMSLAADDHHSKTRVNVAAMGEGISQLLPIVTRVVGSDTRSCVLIEQPEIHLHPSLQADLADLFVEIIGKTERQLVVETHSEHLLLRLRTRIAKGDIDPGKVSILFVTKEGQGSKVTSLKLNGRGHFDEWPKGFFEEAYREAMALAMASVESKKNARPDT